MSESQKSSFYFLLTRLLFLWKWMVLAGLMGFFTIGSNIALLGTSAWLIAKAALQPSIAELNVAIVGVRFFGISRGVFRYLERTISHQVTFRLLKELRVWFYEKIEPLAPAGLIKHRSGDVLTRIVSDIESLENFYIRVIAPFAVALMIAAVMAIGVWLLNPLLLPAVLFFFAITGFVLPMVAWRQGNSQRIVEQRACLNITLLDGVQGMADMLAFQQEISYQTRLRQLSDEIRREQLKQASLSGFYDGLGVLLVQLTVLVALVIAIPRVEGIYLAPLSLVIIASFEAFLPLSLAYQHLQSDLQAGQRLIDITAAGHYLPSVEKTSPQPETFDIRFEQVTFRYVPDEKPALNHISLTVKPGQCLAVVGENGAGKTTLFNLLVKFYDYTAEGNQGDIFLGGYPLSAYSGEVVRDMISVVNQKPHFFNATIAENLRLARPDASDNDLILVAQQAQIHKFIQMLPDGYQTRMGEQGYTLSGGERQRLAIARALLKNAPILILDEPMAHLDSLHEKAVIAALRQLIPTRTTLLITHHVSLLKQISVDEIVVMKHGSIVERGSIGGSIAAG